MKEKAAKTRKPFRLSIRDRSLSFTPLGTRFVVVCTLVGIAAINTGSNLLYLCTAMMLSMVLVSGILSEQALKRLRAARRLPDEIYAGEPFTARYSVENRKRRIPSFALSVCGFGGQAESGGTFILRLPAGETSGGPARETVGSRGRWVTEGFELSTRFPFGLFRKTRRLHARDERLVFPAVRELPGGLPRSLTGGLGDSAAARAGQGAQLRSLREYMPHDDARLIHWKSSARLSRLMAKEFEAEHKTTVTLVLDDLPPVPADDGYAARFEEAVSLAAAAARGLLLEHDVPVGFISRGITLQPAAGRTQYLALMEGLSLIRPYVPGSPGAIRPEDAERMLASAASAGPYVLVLTSRGTAWAGYATGAGLVLEAGP